MRETAERLSNNTEIIGIVSRPGVGKTTFLMKVIDELNLRRKKVLVLS